MLQTTQLITFKEIVLIYIASAINLRYMTLMCFIETRAPSFTLY